MQFSHFLALYAHFIISPFWAQVVCLIIVTLLEFSVDSREEYYVNRKTHQDVQQLIDITSTTSYPHFPGFENFSYVLLKRISEKALVEMSTIELRNKSCQQFSIRAAGQSVTGNSTLAKLKSCRIEK